MTSEDFEKTCRCCGMTYEEAIQDNMVNAFPGSPITHEQAEGIIRQEYFS